ncbi:hypothetical protein GIB67_038301 [Kingdonia uniflora]|uniref:Uncharacterized protein n=1 Tax=Kingdonia uniflora TaxID=39325 RepID=A0A7J7KUH4_9MAGN|nr:hypothetical protein GIB67_038301 [Kingdonia uniflora]
MSDVKVVTRNDDCCSSSTGSKNPKPSSKFVVSSSSEESSSSDRTMDNSEVIGTITVDKPAVPSGRDVGLQAGIETRQFFMYLENGDVAKKFLQYKRGLDGKWGHYVMNAGLWFRTLVRPDGKVDHYQVSSLDKWKGNMGIGDDIDISYYNETGAKVVEDGFLCYLNQVCEPLNKRWRDGGIARQFVADDVLKYYKFIYVKDRKSGYLFSDSARLKFFDFEYARRPWCNHLVMVRGNFMQVPGEPALELIYKNFNEKPNPKGAADTSSLFDVVSREGTELNKVLGVLGIRREKQLNSIVEKVQRAHQNRARATSGYAYDDILEIPACTVGTSSSLVRRPRVKRTVSSSEQIAPAQTPQMGTEGVDVDLSVAWKSVAEVLKVATTDRAEYEVEKAYLAEQLKERTALCEQLQKEKVLQREQFEKEEDIDLSLAGKYSEIIFPGDDASPVVEQSPTPPVADDMTKEEVVRLRGKVSEMEKALSRVRDSINRTQQGQRVMRIIFFNIKKEDRRVQAQLENDLRYARDELELCKDHNACLEMEKVECNKLLQSSDKRTILLEARLLDTQKRLQMSQSHLKKYLTPKRGKRASKTDHECQIADVFAFYGGELERVENEFRCYILSCGKDVDVENDKVDNMWFAKGNEGGGASTSKLRAEESDEEEVEDLLPPHCIRPILKRS